MIKWLQKQYSDIRGNLKWAVLLLLLTAINESGKKLLRMVPYMPDWLVWLIIFLVCAIAFVAVARWHPSAQAVSAPPQGVTGSPGEYQNVDDFYKTYDNKLLVDLEKLFRDAADTAANP